MARFYPARSWENPAATMDQFVTAVLKRKRQVNRTTHFYLLRDFMVCGHCETPMGARTKISKSSSRGNENFYYCPKKERAWVKDAPKDDDKWVRGRSCQMTKSLNIPITDELVWNNVIETVSQSNLMKDMFKTNILSDKFAKDEEYRKNLRDETKKVKKLKRDLDTVETSIATIETDKLLKRIDPPVYRKVRKNLNGELESVKSNLEQSRIRVQELGDQKRWIDWISKHQDKMSSLGDMTIENRKDYLDGILDTISVTLDQNHQHQLSIRFKYPIVGDSHEWDDPKEKSKGYQIHEGSNELEVSQTLTNKGGPNVKKNSRVKGIEPVQRTRWKQVGHCGIGSKNQPTCPCRTFHLM